MKYHSTKSSRSGFTLIELLVVISIIGLLSSVVIASLGSARAKSRDAKRTQDFTQMRNALALYYSDNNSYPDIRTNPSIYIAYATRIDSTSPIWNTSDNPLYAALVPKYISTLPVDPTNRADGPTWYDSQQLSYTYAMFLAPTDGPTDYDLIANFEISNNKISCANRDWIQHTSTNAGTSWCDDNNRTTLFADH